MTFRREWIRSHQTAAQLWGLDLVGTPARPHVTVPRDASRVRRTEVRIHRQDLAAADVVEIAGVLATSPLRTVLDLGRVLPLPEAVGLVDSALRLQRVELASLRRRVGVARGPGARALTRAVALADPRSESFLESYCRSLLAAHGLPRPTVQYTVRGATGRWLARVDLAWPSYRVLVELDGFDFHADRERFRNDRRRQNALELAGWLVLRFCWEDLLGRPEVVVTSVRAALTGSARAA